MSLRNRNIEFDLLRSLIITSAVVLHFSNHYNLGVFPYPFRLINSELFNVGNFFFFTAGYMGHSIYFNRSNIENFSKYIKIFKKGFLILSVYLFFIIIMRLFTDTTVPDNLYDFIWSHRFYTKVLVTFSFVYLVSPFVISLFKKSKLVFFIIFISLYLSYIPSYSEVTGKSYLFGILLGLGDKAIYYSFVASLIVYCIGFIASFVESTFILNNKGIYVSAILLIFVHLLLINLFPFYKSIIHNRKIWLLATSVLIYSSTFTLRYFLLNKEILTFFNKEAVLLIGVKSLTFYVLSNLFLGLLSIPGNYGLLHNFLIFASVFFLSYLFTYWHFLSDFKSISPPLRKLPAVK